MGRNNILISGASSGLGAAMARRFAAMNRNLALCARRTERLDALAAELRSAHPSITVSVRPLDVNDHEAVFETFRAFDTDLAGVDRVIVNAGMGKGAPLGTGHFAANRQTAETNFIAALAQAEAALELFRPRNDGHLVLISSMSAVRGLPRSMNAYAASKAAVSAMGEGLQAEFLRSPIVVSTILPGYIRTELNEKVRDTPMIVGIDKGSQALVRAIEREPRRACVPAWPWRPMDLLIRVMPLRGVAKFG